MPREPSDARAALMRVYMSQRSTFLTLSDPPKGGKKLMAAERWPPRGRIYTKKSATTKKMVKSLKTPPHRRRRSDADECMHGTSTSGPGLGLGHIGRTIYGVGEQRRQRTGLPNCPGLKGSHGRLTAQQVAVIEVGMELARVEAERREVVGKKGMGDMRGFRKGDDRELVGGNGSGTGRVCVKMEDMAHADRYFDMYINAEACG